MNIQDGPNAVPLLRVADWDDQPVPLREWTVQGRIPARGVTLLGGQGGVGKDILLMQLSVACALGLDWFGTLPQQGPVIYLNAEDEVGEIHRRLDVIRAHRGVRFAELGDLHPWPLFNQDAVLAAADRHGTMMQRTARFSEFRERVMDIKPALIVISTLADTFAGNESDRSQTRQFVHILRTLVVEANSSVVLIAHPSLEGIRSGSGLSGSTAWHNSIRARAVFEIPGGKDADDGERELDSDLRTLRWAKNNYGALGEPTLPRWQLIEGTQGGLFVPHTWARLARADGRRQSRQRTLSGYC